MAKQPMDTVMTRLPRDVRERADAIAERELLTRSAWLRRLILTATRGLAA
jgi:hypothetical protein